MLAEPHIVVSGPNTGKLVSVPADGQGNVVGVLPDDRTAPYADFEREKLKELFPKWDTGIALNNRGYCIHDNLNHEVYFSFRLTGYTPRDHQNDSESNRLLKRAEFLKAVCEREGVEWLPKPTDTVKVLVEEPNESYVRFDCLCGETFHTHYEFGCHRKNCPKLQPTKAEEPVCEHESLYHNPEGNVRCHGCETVWWPKAKPSPSSTGGEPRLVPDGQPLEHHRHTIPAGGRDYYTREEANEKMRGLLDTLIDFVWHACADCQDKQLRLVFRDKLEKPLHDLRKRFT